MARLKQLWSRFSDREKRIIAIALIIGVIFVFVNYVFDPWYDNYEDLQLELANRQSLLKRYENLIATSDKAREKLVKMQSLDQSINYVLLDSSTSDLANAELQGLVKNLAQKADITFTRITPNKSVENDGFTEISLRLPFQGNIQQIQTFLYELESSEKFFNIQNFTIKSERRSRRSKSEGLRVDLEIAGYIRSAPNPESEDKDDSRKTLEG